MSTLEERVADLEAKMTPDLRDEMRRGFELVTARFDAIDRRFDAVDQRFNAVEQRFDAVDQRFNAVDQRLDGVDKRLDRIESRVERLDDRTDRRFMWIIGIQFTMMALFIGALVAAVLRGV